MIHTRRTSRLKAVTRPLLVPSQVRAVVAGLTPQVLLVAEERKGVVTDNLSPQYVEVFWLFLVSLVAIVALCI